MAICFSCPACARRLQTPEKNAGHRMICPACGRPFFVPCSGQARPPRDAEAKPHDFDRPPGAGEAIHGCIPLSFGRAGWICLLGIFGLWVAFRTEEPPPPEKPNPIRADQFQHQFQLRKMRREVIDEAIQLGLIKDVTLRPAVLWIGPNWRFANKEQKLAAVELAYGYAWDCPETIDWEREPIGRGLMVKDAKFRLVATFWPDAPRTLKEAPVP